MLQLQPLREVNKKTCNRKQDCHPLPDHCEAWHCSGRKVVKREKQYSKLKISQIADRAHDHDDDDDDDDDSS